MDESADSARPTAAVAASSRLEASTQERRARRLGTTIRHAMHTFALALWLVGLGTTVRQAQRAPSVDRASAVQVLLALVLAGTYTAGLMVRAHRPVQARRAVVGRSWVGAMLLVWSVLVAWGGAWAWLCLPLLFLVLFILPSPWRWTVVAAAAAWAALSPLVRGESLTVGQVVGPLFGAAFAVVVHQVFVRLRRDVHAQREMTDQIARLAAEQARTDEREALARDLHDTLAQGLNSIVVLARATAREHPEAAEQVGAIEASARANLAQARLLVRRMADPVGTLADELRSVVDEVASTQRAGSSPLAIEFRTEGTPVALPAAVHQAAVMATRSLLGNVVQHARATRCVVSLAWLDDAVLIDVADDGTGFAPGAGRPDSFGLVAMRARVDELGGRLEVESTPGDGTTVGVQLPITPTDRGTTADPRRTT